LPEKSIKLVIAQAAFLKSALDFFLKGIIFALIEVPLLSIPKSKKWPETITC